MADIKPKALKGLKTNNVLMSIKDKISESFSKFRDTVTRSEDLSGRDQLVRDLAGGLGLRASEFISDVYNEKTMDPHAEMRGAQKLYRLDPLVVSSTQLFVDSIMGNELSVETEDGEAKAYFEENIIPKIKSPLRESIENMVVTGNGYIEVMRKNNNADGIPLDFKTIARSEKMFIDYEKGFNPKRYVLEMPKASKWDSYGINYMEGRKKRIHGIKFEPSEVIHLKYGASHVPVYGRSGLCSAVDSGKILRELERDMAVIARYKSIPRKIINIKNQDGTSLSQKERQSIKQEMESIDDSENLLIHGKEVEVKDLSYDGSLEDIDTGLDFLKNKITSTIAPSFYVHGEETNYAVAQEQKSMYYLRVQAMRDQISTHIEKVFNEIANARGFNDNISLSFGDFDFPTREQKIEEVQNKFKSGVMTLNEARDELDLPEDPENGDKYIYELKEENQLKEAVDQVMDEEDETEDKEEETEDELDVALKENMLDTYEKRQGIITKVEDELDG